MKKLFWLALGLIAAAFIVAACGDDSGDSAQGCEPATGDPVTINVPDDEDTIQKAVDKAPPGSLVTVSPGTYEEAVDVCTDDVVIRGLDRNEVVLDGGLELENGVRVLEADGVAVENLTAMNYTGNGVFWSGVDGYRGSYLTTIRNGGYGVYALGSVNGLLEKSYASGSSDAGFYIGQCYECHAVIDDVVSEWNGLGYSGTNAGGDLYVINSVWRNNRLGIQTNSGSYEGCAPQTDSVFAGNLVHDNNNPGTDAIDDAILGMGNGILILGGHDDLVTKNQVQNHDIAGIAVVPMPEFDAVTPIIEETPSDPCTEDEVPVSEEEQEELENPQLWFPLGNQVIDNVASNSGDWDVVILGEAGDGNCVAGNQFGVISPENAESVIACGGETQAYDADFGRFLEIVDSVDERPPPVDYKDVDLPDPGPQDNMPDAANAPAVPGGPPPAVDLDAITVPDPI